jgi:phage-related protein
METRRQRQLSEYLLWYTRRVVKEQPPRKIPLVFFRTSSGSEPVREWLKRLDESDRRAIGQDLLRAQWRWPVAMPLCRAMGSGLWEVRTTLAGNRASRVLMCVCENHLVALHGFIKKTRATPDNDLALAKKRQTELEQ